MPWLSEERGSQKSKEVVRGEEGERDEKFKLETD